jgi:wyosine [tRNA(Phe)-imidazoG37] synthetase (radical SAM superfamily)
MNPMRPNPERSRAKLIRDHRRQWRDCLYVYPVISRRAKGLSVGVNLNPDKRCSFSCLYCQIDRRVGRNLRAVHLPTLRRELAAVLAEAASGRIWAEPRFASTPAALRRINDIAFSGDGEPTCLADFDRAVAVAAEVKSAAGLGEVKLVVLTNASRLDSRQLQRALPVLDAHNGEIWAKLDAGTEAYFRRVNRPQEPIRLAKIVADIAAVARGRELVIQTLWFRIDGQGPPADEVDAYCRRLQEILAAGGGIRLVQVHTVARPPADRSAAALADEELDALAERVRSRLGGVPVEAYYASPTESP